MVNYYGDGDDDGDDDDDVYFSNAMMRVYVQLMVKN
jgi:hypothetical protein